MPSTGFTGGPWNLTNNGIDSAITQTSPGAYALGRTGDDGTFFISYVGRSDDDLNRRLKDHVGAYKTFKAGYLSGALSAFQKECQLYHDFGGVEGKLDNKAHPDRPKGSAAKCPVCG